MNDGQSQKPSPTDEVREMYEDTAESYATMMDSEIDLPVYTEVLGRLDARLANIAGLLIDTACGSGHMLSMYHDQYDQHRPLMGIDLSPRMVSISSERLGSSARVVTGDMRELQDVEEGSAAAILNYFALHHLDLDGVEMALGEWHRVLCSGGLLFLATWEGIGPVDYGDEADIVAFRYSSEEICSAARAAGFAVTRCVVEPVAEIPMDAIYLECSKE